LFLFFFYGKITSMSGIYLFSGLFQTKRVLGMALFLCPFFLFAQADKPDFVVKDRVLVKYRGVDRVIVIPTSLGINRIGAKAFFGTPVTSVEIPMGVATIDEQAFMNCSFLKIVRLPNTLTTLGRRAFFNCFLLETINIPRSLMTIEDGVFYNCRNLKEIFIPDTLKKLGSRAFASCLGLEKVTVSRRTVLGDHPFMGVQCKITYTD
jgi:hypothetical protein